MPKAVKPSKEIRQSQRDQKYQIKDLVAEIETIPEQYKLELLEKIGVGRDYLTCYMCGQVKPYRHFHSNTDPMIQTGVSRICKECAEKIAMPIDPKTGIAATPTLDSVKA